MMHVRCLTLGAFQVNAYLLEDAETGACAIVDVGDDGQLAEALAQMEPRPKIEAILLTHAHFDHVGGLVDVQKLFPKARTYLPALERPMFDVLPQQGSLLFGMKDFNRPCGRIDQEIKQGEIIAVGTLRFQFLSTPGHTPGQGCYYNDQYIFVGDTIFAGSVGRTDFPMSDPELMQQSLARLMELPGSLIVCSGHGPVTTLEEELQTNPFLETVRNARGIVAPRSTASGRRWN